jgi:hypothetical protein
MRKFVCLTANKAECELENGRKAQLRTNAKDRSEKPPMNPPKVKPDRFAPKSKANLQPRRIDSPVASAIRGDQKPQVQPTNAEIMELLLKVLGK